MRTINEPVNEYAYAYVYLIIHNDNHNDNYIMVITRVHALNLSPIDEYIFLYADVP